MDLSIIIVNYNTAEKLVRCLDSISRSDLAGIETEIVIVDNHSTEPLPNIGLPGLRVATVANPANVGMGAGNNVGILRSKGEYVLVLNPDTELAPDAIRRMISHLKLHTAVGVVGPKLLYPDGTLQPSCFRFPGLFLPLLRRTFFGRIARERLDRFMMADCDLSATRNVDWLMGSCLMVPRRVLDRVGLFDERFFMYFEDTDLCRRINAAGLAATYLPSAVVTHHHGRASAKERWFLSPFINKMSRIHIASWLKYLWKWRGGRA